jgi:dihydrofolate reductase
MINAIVCVDTNWGIGKDNDLLFSLPKDMNHFKIMTTNSIVVCGRKTLESFPGNKPLKNRSTICLCSAKNNREDCFCINSFEEAIKLIQELSKTKDIWIIGGQSIYSLFMDYIDKVYVTKVEADGNGTAFFPNLDENKNFKVISTTGKTEDNGYTISFWIYKRIGGIT